MAQMLLSAPKNRNSVPNHILTVPHFGVSIQRFWLSGLVVRAPPNPGLRCH